MDSEFGVLLPERQIFHKLEASQQEQNARLSFMMEAQNASTRPLYV